MVVTLLTSIAPNLCKLFLLGGLFFPSEHIFLNCSHELFIFCHLLERFTDIFEDEQIGEIGTQHQKFLQILVWGVFFTNSALFKHSEKVFCFHYLKRLLFCF